MQILDCDRYGCKLQDGQVYTHYTLRHDWVCSECEGRLEHLSQWDPDTEIVTDWLECGRCGGREIKRITTIRNEQVQAVEVLAGLPMELQQAAEKARRAQCQVATQEAASLLYERS